MTCIVWDGKTLASDSQITSNGAIGLAPFKKIYFPDDKTEYWEANGKRVIAFAVAGDARSIDYIKHELHKGITYRTQVDVEDDMFFSTILVTEDLLAYDWTVDTNKEKRNTHSALIPHSGPIAKGSGGRYAIAIMAIGKDAKSAVKAAIRLDPHSGGDIIEFVAPEAPATPSVRPEHLKSKVEEPKAKDEDKKDGKKEKPAKAA